MLRPSRWWVIARTFARSPGDHADDPRELARAVRDQKRDDEVPTRGGQPVADDRVERGRVDVPAREDRAHRTFAADAPGEERGDRRGARSLDDELHTLEQEDDRLRDLLVVDDDHVVEQVVEDRPRSARRDASPRCRPRSSCRSAPVRRTGAHAAAWTPTTRSSGRSASSASATPAARPPPPTGITTVPGPGGSSSTSSSPSVP